MRAGFEYEYVRWPLTFGGLGRGNLMVNSFADFLIGRAGCASSRHHLQSNQSGQHDGFSVQQL